MTHYGWTGAQHVSRSQELRALSR